MATDFELAQSPELFEKRRQVVVLLDNNKVNLVVQQFLSEHSDPSIGRVSVHDQFVQTDAEHKCSEADDRYRGEAEMCFRKR